MIITDKSFTYLDFESGLSTVDIDMLFPGWKDSGETVCVFSPHDDDALIGAGYAISAALANGAKVFIVIFCKGNFGYAHPSLKDKIVSIRKAETYTAYARVGVAEEDILRLDYMDNEVINKIGWMYDNKFMDILHSLRQKKITRLLLPNHYREHTDHMAVNIIGAYGAPQAGDRIITDLGEPQEIGSIMEYSVWADFSPEDALVCKRNSNMRANKAIVAEKSVEDIIREGIKEYQTQLNIIDSLVDSRDERALDSHRFIETYLAFDPRPKMDYNTYVKTARSIL